MRQNYISQLNLFYRWLETHYLSASAQLLWFKLIGLFNVCGWAEWVQIDTRRLMAMICVENKQTAFRARDALVEAGLLEYRKGKKHSPTRYRMHWFRYDFRTENETDCVTDPVTERVTESVPETVHIHKQNENENENINKTVMEPASEDVYVPPALADAWDAYAGACRAAGSPMSADSARSMLHTIQYMAPNDWERQKLYLCAMTPKPQKQTDTEPAS